MIVDPPDVNLTQMAEAFLPCIAYGTPPPALTWYKTEETGGQPALLPLVGKQKTQISLQRNSAWICDTMREERVVEVGSPL